jgi:hypothetical protein
VLEEDFARIPDLLSQAVDPPLGDDEPRPAYEPEPESVQLGLF